MGLGQIRQGNYDKAIEHFSTAIERNQEEADYFVGRGIAYLEKMDFALAKTDLDKALEIDGKNSFAWYFNGLLDYELEDYLSAVGKFSRAIGIDGDKSTYYMGRGLAYRKLGLYKSALASLNQAIGLEPKNLLAFFIRGTVYGKSGDEISAEAEFNYIIQQKPVWAEHYLARGFAYRVLGKYQLAIDDMNRVMKIQPNSDSARFQKARLLTYTLRNNKAIENYNWLIKKIPKNFIFHNNRGFNYCVMRQFKQCIEDLDRAIELNPDFTPAYLNRSKAHSAMNLNDLASQDLRTAEKSIKDQRKNYDYWLDKGVDIFIETSSESRRYLLLP